MLSTTTEGSSREGEICCFSLSLLEVATLCPQTMGHGNKPRGFVLSLFLVFNFYKAASHVSQAGLGLSV